MMVISSKYILLFTVNSCADLHGKNVKISTCFANEKWDLFNEDVRISKNQ